MREIRCFERLQKSLLNLSQSEVMRQEKFEREVTEAARAAFCGELTGDRSAESRTGRRHAIGQVFDHITDGTSSTGESSSVRGRSAAMRDVPAVRGGLPGGPPAGKFIIDGDVFLLEYHCDGQTERGIFPTDKFVGLYYHHYLVLHAARDCTSEQLYFGPERQRRTPKRSSVHADEAASTGTTFVAHNLFEEPLDEYAIKAYKGEVRELTEAIAEEEQAGFSEKAEELRAKRDFILDHVAQSSRHGRKEDLLYKSVRGLSSSLRNQNNAASKTTGAVRKAIRDAQGRIEKKSMPILAEHFRRKVLFKNGRWTYYPSEPPCNWNL